jgi:hypothetical protein
MAITSVARRLCSGCVLLPHSFEANRRRARSPKSALSTYPAALAPANADNPAANRRQKPSERNQVGGKC